MKRLLVLPDLHIRPKGENGEDALTLRAVERYMAEQKWDEVIQLGDFMDFNVISSHNKDNLRAVANASVRRDYDAGNRVLDRWQKLHWGPLTILEGNHDFRIERYIDARPELEGLLEVPVGLGLKSRGIKWIPSWSKGLVYKKGKANFLHGLYTSDHHAKAMVSKFGMNVFYGHMHDEQSYSLTRYGDNSTIVGQSLGCLCKYRQYYAKNRPNRWQQAIAEFYIQPNGNFQHFVTKIFSHAFTAPTGEFYDGKKN